MGLFAAPQKESSIASVFGKTVSRSELKNPEKESAQSLIPKDLKAPSPEVEPPTAIDSDEDVSGDSDADMPKVAEKPKKPTLDDKTKQEQTVFFGNLNSSIITDKSAFKEFKQFVRQFGTVVSIRFRSIAFSELLPRKAAYILQRLHPARDAINAYVVYKTADSVNKALEVNGSVFLDHHVRVDSIANPAPHYRKRSVFLGNMDFEAKEEELYRHFETCGPIEYVRIVRDAKTNVGKGFGYVQFKDAATVPLAIMMNNTPFSGRPLRITHCKLKSRSSDSSEPNSKTNGKNGKNGKNDSHGKRKFDKSHKHKSGKRSFEVLEGERAKQGDSVGLGKKKKPRHRNDPTKKKQKK